MATRTRGTEPGTRPKPAGWAKRLMDLPVRLYRSRLGFVFGGRLVVLVHHGRNTGAKRHTALEVLRHRAIDGEYRVISGWGRTSDWFRNIEASPPEALWVGRRRSRVTHRVLGPDEAVATVRAHLLARPRVSARITPNLWRALQAGEVALAREMEALPVVGFRPVEEVLTPAGVGVAPAFSGIGQVIWHLLATPFIGRRRLRWGATEAEAVARLPGDELVPDPKWSFTYGVGIDAPPESVWPWIVQIGQGRGGFYSYQTLENMVGCRIRNTAEIVQEHQHPQIGDGVRLHPEAPPMRIAVLDEPTAFVLHGAPAGVGDDEGFAASTWQFAIVPQPLGGSRLLMRGRSDHSSQLVNRIAFGRFPLEPISFVMSRRMLREIKRLAEANALRAGGPPS